MLIFGRSARRLSLLLALIHLGLTAAVVIPAMSVLEDRDKTSQAVGRGGWIRFRPEFVPGDTMGTAQCHDLENPRLVGESAFVGTGRAEHSVLHRRRWIEHLACRAVQPDDDPGDSRFVGLNSREDRRFLLPAVLAPGSVVGAFLSFDVILFYVFFELTLIPAFFLIGRWGTGSGRRDAARKFFLYTLAGSLLTLVGIIGIVLTNPSPTTGQITFSLPELMANVQAKLADCRTLRPGLATPTH